MWGIVKFLFVELSSCQFFSLIGAKFDEKKNAISNIPGPERYVGVLFVYGSQSTRKKGKERKSALKGKENPRNPVRRCVWERGEVMKKKDEDKELICLSSEF